MIDQRTQKMEGTLSDMADIDAAYRELCEVHSYNFSKAKAHTDSQQRITASGLLKLCILLNLKIQIDGMKDEFIIWYPEKGNKPVKIVLDEETEKLIENNNPQFKDVDENEEIEKIKFTDIKQAPLNKDGDELEDLF